MLSGISAGQFDTTLSLKNPRTDGHQCLQPGVPGHLYVSAVDECEALLVDRSSQL